MSKDNTETEVKIKVRDLKTVEDKLRAAGATLKAERVREYDVRYDDAENTLTSSARVLRLRQDSRVRLTYKGKGTATSGGALTRTELEVTISDFDTMGLILSELGYHVAWIYEKYRTTYEVNDCEVVLDEMPFGPFIEVEGDDAGINKTLTALGLSDAPRIHESYSALFFRIKDRLRLPFRDLTFDNFKGIVVPDAMFK